MAGAIVNASSRRRRPVLTSRWLLLVIMCVVRRGALRVWLSRNVMAHLKDGSEILVGYKS